MAAKRNKDTLTKAGEAVTSAAKTAAAVAQEYVVEPARKMLGLSDAPSDKKKKPARKTAARKKSRPAAAAPRKRPAKKARKKAKSK